LSCGCRKNRMTKKKRIAGLGCSSLGPFDGFKEKRGDKPCHLFSEGYPALAWKVNPGKVQGSLKTGHQTCDGSG
jgi:hypothetical protein